MGAAVSRLLFIFGGRSVDLRQYFKKIRDIESGLADLFPVVVSLETPDGGKAGIKTEVPSQVAAKMIVDSESSALRMVVRLAKGRHAIHNRTSMAITNRRMKRQAVPAGAGLCIGRTSDAVREERPERGLSTGHT